MKKKFLGTTLLVLLISLLAFPMTGCKSDRYGNTYVEPKITVDYLTTEFADQITRDGATKRFGTIDAIQNNGDGTYTFTMNAKEFVVDNSQPNGFYIADRNQNYELILSKSARSVFFPGGDSSRAEFYLSAADFIQALEKDRSKNNASGYEEYQLFYFYVMHDYVELVLQQYLP
jgi:hypothetical protein